MQYLCNTKKTTLINEPGEHPSWWVNRSYAVHTDMQSHGGMLMILGKGNAYRASYEKIQQMQNVCPFMMQWHKYYGPVIL